ncbi:SRPBCC family protein [Pseudooceanicola sp. CBS1P-1]|uniref:SRPBCC family protein n=1 Tax=Pseudooceanicola albus TaxID=2692189 RepID=A0A6L7G904_9RHOB|nr:MULTISPECIES: SRPBCC family protein [Pseudooceanicola]MBT9386393.1 SRPBCC family protein [Pseudooceanicola endophyticus]MXN20449.1 SRPBCC family protein [Pseudooceanicola albus]
MKIVARQDIDAPVEDAFARITDFRSFERAAMRRGAQVRRSDGADPPQVGAGWEVSFRYRGRARLLRLTLSRFEPPEMFLSQMQTEGLEGQCLAELTALSPSRCRLRVEIELRPRTLAARLLVQSMKLAKGRLRKRLQERLQDLATGLDLNRDRKAARRRTPRAG